MSKPDKPKKPKSRGKRAFFNCPHCDQEHSQFLNPPEGKTLVTCLECSEPFVLKWVFRIFIRTATFDFGKEKPSRRMEYHETKKNPGKRGTYTGDPPELGEDNLPRVPVTHPNPPQEGEETK